MNEQQRAVVQQALEALEKTGNIKGYAYEREKEAHAALRQLLEQPVQEPVGEVSGHDWGTGLLYRDLEPGTPLYTTPPAQPAARVGLTDEKRMKLYAKMREATPTYTTPPAQPETGPFSAPIKELWPVAQTAEPDYKKLYEQLCEQYDVLVNELKGTP
jgi:hypothetical protein